MDGGWLAALPMIGSRFLPSNPKILYVGNLVGIIEPSLRVQGRTNAKVLRTHPSLVLRNVICPLLINFIALAHSLCPSCRRRADAVADGRSPIPVSRLFHEKTESVFDDSIDDEDLRGEGTLFGPHCGVTFASNISHSLLSIKKCK